MKKGWYWPFAAIILLLMVGGSLYLLKQQKEPKAAGYSFSRPACPAPQPAAEVGQEPGIARERIPVKIIPARKSKLEVMLPVFGAVTYVDKCDVSYEESGSLIKDVLVLIGDIVRPGQPVAVIDTDILQEELKAKRANLDQMKALLDLAAWKYEAQRKVHAKGGTSLQELEEASATYQARISELAQIQAEIGRLETRLKKAVIRSPIYGIVGKKNYYPGERVPLSSEKGIVTIFRIDQVYVEAEISEKDLTKIRPGLEVAVYPDAYLRTRFSGILEQLEPIVKEQNRTVIARIRVKNDNFLLKPGMFTRLEIILEKTPEVVNIPLQALRTSPDKSTEVFVIVDNVAFKKEVELGLTTATSAEIKAGLEPGDMVVVEGGDQLKELSRVIAIPDQAPSLSP
jgi:membrane fusion protein (multidrug efflux system)